MGFVVFCLVLVTVFYGQLLLKESGIIPVMLITQYGFFLVPCVVIVLAMKFPFRQTLFLRMPNWRGAAAAVLVGLSCWSVAVALVTRVLPPPESLVKALERILLLDGKPHALWISLALFALSPALCEEILFRGLILSAFRWWGPWLAMAGSAVLFGVAHASVYRLLPTAALGFVIAYTVWRTGSVVSGMIVHGINNGLAILFLHNPSWARSLHLEKAAVPPISLTVAGVAVLCFGLVLLGLPKRTASAASAPAQ
jgi:sodium transport system permease protein